MTAMPAERIFMIFILAPLLMFIWEHVVLDHQHVHPLADGTTTGCSEVGCEDGCGMPVEPPDTSVPGGGWAFKPKKAKPSERSSLLGKGKKGAVAPSGEAAAAGGGEPWTRRWMPKMLRPGCQPVWLIWLFEKWALLTRVAAWLIHSFFDGIILGSSDPRPQVMLPLTFAILVCAVQVTTPTLTLTLTLTLILTLTLTLTLPLPTTLDPGRGGHVHLFQHAQGRPHLPHRDHRRLRPF